MRQDITFFMKPSNRRFSFRAALVPIEYVSATARMRMDMELSDADRHLIHETHQRLLESIGS